MQKLIAMHYLDSEPSSSYRFFYLRITFVITFFKKKSAIFLSKNKKKNMTVWKRIYAFFIFFYPPAIYFNSPIPRVFMFSTSSGPAVKHRGQFSRKMELYK